MNINWVLLIFIAAGFAAGLLLGGLVAWLYAAARASKQQEELLVLAAELQARIDNAQEKTRWLEESREQMKESFESLASHALKQSSDELLKRSGEQVESLLSQARGDWNTHKTEMEKLVDPLKDDLDKLDKQIEQIEQKREGAYQGLEEQLRQLSASHSELQATTVNLSQALRSPVARGRWGEVQLRRVVELAGMVKHVAFDEQAHTESGRPDMVVYMPNQGLLPVDSKVPLNAYLESIDIRDEEQRTIRLQQHSKAVRERVRELSQKKYWEQFEQAPEFVVMFVPNESALSAAFENDPGLFEFAADQRVLLTSPVTLLALLRAVSYGWQQTSLTENARQIAKQGQVLYKRFIKFSEHMNDLRSNLNRSVDSFNRLVGSLERRVLPAANKLQEMGVGDTRLEAPESIDQQARLVDEIDKS
jgi:DNA recombination protein RmuC